MNRKIIFVASHGEFAKELVKSAEMIIGPIEDCYSFSLLPSMNPESIASEMQSIISNNKDEQIICLVDLFGGSPCFSVISLLENNDNIQVITGLTLAMFIEVATQRDNVDMEELTEIAISTLKNSARDINKFIKGEQ